MDDGARTQPAGTGNHVDDLTHLFSAYFYDAWNEYEYASWQDAVDDFIGRSPERVAGAVSQLSELLEAPIEDDELSARLQELGCAFAPGEGDRPWLQSVLDRLRGRLRPTPSWPT